jgi:DegV family protein with EDD domain
MRKRRKEPTMAIHIVTDSTACLPQGYAEEHGVTVVPLKVSLDGEYFRDGIDIANDEFYRRLVAGAKAGTTQPGPEDFIAVYAKLLADPEDEVLSIHISSLLSGTLNSAHAAAAMTESRRVVLSDSRTVGLALGFMVMEAVHLAETGAAIPDIVAALDAMQPRTHIYFLIGTMKYLIEGGRIGKAAGVAASILQIKPILMVKDGIVDVFERPRTMRTARDRMWALIDQAVVRGIEHIGFHYGANRVEMEDFQREFTSRYNLPSILTKLGPVLGTYSGPDMIGVVITEKKTP